MGLDSCGWRGQTSWLTIASRSLIQQWQQHTGSPHCLLSIRMQKRTRRRDIFQMWFQKAVISFSLWLLFRVVCLFVSLQLRRRKEEHRRRASTLWGKTNIALILCCILVWTAWKYTQAPKSITNKIFYIKHNSKENYTPLFFCRLIMSVDFFFAPLKLFLFLAKLQPLASLLDSDFSKRE